ncbi:MAG: arginine--tRNA ligase [Solirubrobacteraceae bacterium]
MSPLTELRDAVGAAAAALRPDGEAGGPAPTLERPKKAEFGDYSTNAAMLLAPVLGESPRDIAGRLGDELAVRLGAGLERHEVAGPDFLNLFLSDGWHRDALGAIAGAGDGFGAGTAAEPERVLIEFVSANPTGPLTAAGGRHAAYGDALARILELAGHTVEREYYFNDAGSQIRRLGESIRARARGEDVPEGGYEGDYVAVLAGAIPDAAGGDPDTLARAGVDRLMEGIRATLERYRVPFDSFFLERSLHEGDPSPVARALAGLEAAGHLYEHEGAVWLRTTTFGDDKDRVLRRSSGEGTYFAADVAYHEHKRARGFDRLVDVLGADHHGYVGRMRALFGALGADPAALEIIIMQFVHIVERGERASMSKRRGDFVTLDELLDEIGVDAARFFMLQRSHDTTIDLDLDLAREQSSDNPVYYVQYAHARIASMRVKAGQERVAAALAGAQAAEGPGEALHPAERALVRKLIDFATEAEEAAERRAPHRIAGYALELAQEFTALYRDCRVLGAEPEGVASWRLALSATAQRTLARSLGLLGVAAPDAM